jgi:hypothetical protein
MNKKIISRFIGIVVVCTLVIIIGAKYYLKNSIRCQIRDISVHDILDQSGSTITVDDFLNGFSSDFGLNENMKSQIRLDPLKYKIVSINYTIDNISNLISLYNVGIVPKYNSNLSSIVVGNIDTVQSDDSPLSIQSSHTLDAKFMFIVKTDDENDEILKYIQKSCFLLDGSLNGFNMHFQVEIDSKK